MGNRRTLRKQGRLNNINHRFVLAALEKHPLRFCNGSVGPAAMGANTMDEMGSVEPRRETMEEDKQSRRMRDEWQKVRNVSQDI
jgi:hypothetical protein